VDVAAKADRALSDVAAPGDRPLAEAAAAAPNRIRLAAVGAESSAASTGELRPDRVPFAASEGGNVRPITPGDDRPPFGSGASSANLAGVSRPEPGSIEPLAPGRYKVQFTASAALCEKLERLQALLTSKGESGLAAVIEAAVDEKLRRLEATRLAFTAKPWSTVATSDVRPVSRKVPAAVRREVWRRDAGQCRFVSKDGQRCTERRWLEIHHRHPFGMGGDHRPANLMLTCSRHNRYLAELDYGRGMTAAPVWDRIDPRRPRPPARAG
jgi:5-methylcytosine-specific restriction endonuclease McrA